MTVVPPLNHSAYPCPDCATPPLTAHTGRCDGTRPGLAFPDLARVFAGLLIGLPIGAALWALLLTPALVIWSLT